MLAIDGHFIVGVIRQLVLICVNLNVHALMSDTFSTAQKNIF